MRLRLRLGPKHQDSLKAVEYLALRLQTLEAFEEAEKLQDAGEPPAKTSVPFFSLGSPEENWLVSCVMLLGLLLEYDEDSLLVAFMLAGLEIQTSPEL